MDRETANEVLLPKWLLAIIGAASTVLSTGMIAWMNNLHTSVNDLKIQYAQSAERVNAIIEKIDSDRAYNKLDSASVDRRLSRIEEKLDRAPWLTTQSVK